MRHSGGGGTMSGPQHNNLEANVCGQTLRIQTTITATINVITATIKIAFNIVGRVVEMSVSRSASPLTLVLYDSLGKGGPLNGFWK